MKQSLFSQDAVYTYPADTLTVPYAPAEDTAAADVDSSLGFGLLPADVRNDTTSLCTESVGMEMEGIPYHPHVDNVFVSTLLFCFFLLAFTLAAEKHYLAQRIENMFYVREKPDLFSVNDVKSSFACQLLLSLFTSLLLALVIVDCSYEVTPQLFQICSLPLLLGGYLLAVILFVAFKVGLFTLADWVFFDKEKNSLWIESYVLICSLGGLFLFMLLLSFVYFDLSNLYALISVGLIAILVETLLFYKCFKVFFNKKYGCVYLIVYFCTLELVPCLLFGKTLITANSLLITNY